MGEVVPARTSPTLHPPPLPLCINCRDLHFKSLVSAFQMVTCSQSSKQNTHFHKAIVRHLVLQLFQRDCLSHIRIDNSFLQPTVLGMSNAMLLDVLKYISHTDF